MSMDNIGCETFGIPTGSLPCDANPIQAMSMGIVTGGIALIFSIFLMKNVGRICRLKKCNCLPLQFSFWNRSDVYGRCSSQENWFYSMHMDVVGTVYSVLCFVTNMYLPS